MPVLCGVSGQVWCVCVTIVVSVCCACAVWRIWAGVLCGVCLADTRLNVNTVPKLGAETRGLAVHTWLWNQAEVSSHAPPGGG